MYLIASFSNLLLKLSFKHLLITLIKNNKKNLSCLKYNSYINNHKVFTQI